MKFYYASLISIIYLYWNPESHQNISIIIDVVLDLFINFYVTTGSGIRLKRLRHWFVSHPRTDFFFFFNAHTEHYYCITKIAQPNKPLGDTIVWKLLCTIKKKNLTAVQKILTVVFIIPVPWVRIELAMCRILIVFKCLLLLVLSMKIWKAGGEKWGYLPKTDSVISYRSR